jgi:hypothetical protein
MSLCLFAEGYYILIKSNPDLLELYDDTQEENDGKEERDNLTEKEVHFKCLKSFYIPFTCLEAKKNLSFDNDFELVHQTYKSHPELPPELV